MRILLIFSRWFAIGRKKLKKGSGKSSVEPRRVVSVVGNNSLHKGDSMFVIGDDSIIVFAQECITEELMRANIKAIYVERWEQKFDKVLKYPYAA